MWDLDVALDGSGPIIRRQTAPGSGEPGAEDRPVGAGSEAGVGAETGPGPRGNDDAGRQLGQGVGGVRAEAFEPVSDQDFAGASGSAGTTLAVDEVAAGASPSWKVANFGVATARANELRLTKPRVSLGLECLTGGHQVSRPFQEGWSARKRAGRPDG